MQIMMVCAGTPYMLATFGPTLKRRFQFSESQIMTVQSRFCAFAQIFSDYQQNNLTCSNNNSTIQSFDFRPDFSSCLHFRSYRRSAQVGMYLGLLQGLYFDRFGVRAAALLAALLLFAGQCHASHLIFKWLNLSELNM